MRKTPKARTRGTVRKCDGSGEEAAVGMDMVEEYTIAAATLPRHPALAS